ncbi:hypothetical protein Y032_0042g695 [Ancylostoma ceylanicum]|uniref:Uncharacterized protein n=1 Tax=Ancylostoma ceylanicum TaxID=53326 RepID=A0A016UFJ7_9BILA|nr:hypothetical protein Y032_0042g695 [Ancylostoma ceylanicum]
MLVHASFTTFYFMCPDINVSHSASHNYRSSSDRHFCDFLVLVRGIGWSAGPTEPRSRHSPTISGANPATDLL